MIRTALNACLFCIGVSIVIQNWRLTREVKNLRLPPPGVALGQQLHNLAGVDLNEKLRRITDSDLTDTLIVTVSPTCPACSSDQANWNVLSNAIREGKATRIIWVILEPSVEKALTYCKENNIPQNEVLIDPSFLTYVQLNLGSVPNAIAVHHGVMVRQWGGLLKKEDWSSISNYYHLNNTLLSMDSRRLID